MALTHNGVVNSLPEGQLPSGYTRPTVTTFTDWEYKRVAVFSIAKTAVENATPSTTMTNLINDATNGIDKLVEDELNNDYDVATATVTAYSDWTGLTTNQTPETGSGSSWLDTTAEAYQCTVSIYIKVS